MEAKENPAGNRRKLPAGSIENQAKFTNITNNYQRISVKIWLIALRFNVASKAAKSFNRDVSYSHQNKRSNGQTF